MKIIFICGSLEPGCDGVGDYTRRLAIELIHCGHNAQAIAINDKYQKVPFLGFQESESGRIEVLRIPSSLKDVDKYNCASTWIKESNPDWLSLQFVPFSFHSKGLPAKIGSHMRSIGTGKNWHIMFHELWLGMSIESSFSKLVWGWLQRKIIRSLILSVNPKKIHTQCNLYKAELEKNSISSTILPLFSNIPTSGNIRKPIDGFSKEKLLIDFVVFGAIHSCAPIDKLAIEAASLCAEIGVTITLIIIGRSGSQQKRWCEVWKSEGLPVKLLGEQPAENISKVLLSSFLGISTTSISVIEKSGSVAAMREHGLPVLVVAKSWKPRNLRDVSVPDGVLEYKKGILKEIIKKYQNNNEQKIAPIRGVSLVSKQLIEDLSTVY